MDVSLRKQIKARKPRNFFRHEAGQKKRIKLNWRRPKGGDNKLRLNNKGHEKRPSMGYRYPKELRDVHTATGLKIQRVTSIKELEGIDGKKTGIIVSSTMGTRKKMQIFELVKQKKITIINIKDTDAYAKRFEEKKKAAKAKQQATAQKKAAKKKDEKKESKEEQTPAAEEQKEEKKEQEKILHHKQ